MILLYVVFMVALSCRGQSVPGIPFSFPGSFRPIARAFTLAPGREAVVSDIIVRHYKTNITSPTSYKIKDLKGLLTDPDFDVNRPTVLYFHGYVELYTDDSVVTVMSAYLREGNHNILLLDWSNLAFGNYVIVLKSIPGAGKYVGKALRKLVQKGLSVKLLHLLGHSMGCHLAAYVARHLASNGLEVARMTGLDPAFPGFYLPTFALPMSPTDATFVDAIHTSAGTYGAPVATAQADYWPNGGQPVQPGCLPVTVPLTIENFCSHWRSWAFYAESVNAPGSFLARRCQDYDTFLRGGCDNETVVEMGFKAQPGTSGNFYLMTGVNSPFGLRQRGAS